MTKARKLAGALMVCGVASIAMGLGSTASASPRPTGATAMTADDDATAGKCRWVKTRGLVCETELGTIGL